jgi:hypothetical protein
MTHLLIIRDASGKDIARVPVEAGYTTKEVVLLKKGDPVSRPDKAVAPGDAGAGAENVG